VTYPNVLVAEYLKRARRAQPEAMIKAMELINLGYQRLLTFEVSGGGFHWFGQPPANLILSAWGLLEFADMAKVYEIDERILERTRNFIFSKQAADGSWVEPSTGWCWNNVQGPLVQTAYIAWALLEAGQTGEPIDKAVAFVKARAAEAGENGYILALIANILALRKDPMLDEIMAKLEALKIEKEGATSWPVDGKTLYFAQGAAASVEATSLVALAQTRSPKYAASASRSLSYLVKTRDGQGSWGSTQATILALKALVAGMSAAPLDRPVEVVVRANGREERIVVEPDQADVMRQLDLTAAARTGDNRVSVAANGEAPFVYQFVARHWLPWSEVRQEEASEPLTIRVSYDRTRLSKDDTVRASVKMRYNGKSPTFMVIVDLGIPGGFAVENDSFEKMAAEKKIDKFQVTARQAILYFGKLEPGQEIEFSYDLRARYPIRVKTPVSEAYEYYSPDRRGMARPTELEVQE
jgi:hypothetical protein